MPRPNTPHLRRAVAALLAAVGIVLAFLLAAPASLGGTTTWVSTTGVSMEPEIHSGDLVIARPAATYRTGDAVAYRSQELGGTVVLHRIVGGSPTGFITRGDNNSWLDPDRPSSEQILGRMWIHIPGGGRMLSVFTNPLLIILGVLAALAATGSGVAVQRSRQRRGHSPKRARRHSTQGPPTAAGRATLPPPEWAALAALVLTTVSLFAFSQPLTTRVQNEVEFTNSAELGYSASVQTRGVYTSNRVRTGDPVFLALVPKIETHLHYRLQSTSSEVSGTIQAVARIAASNGWEHTATLTAPKRFTGPQTDHQASVDFTALLRAAQAAEKAAGTAFGGYTVDISYRINIDGTIEGSPAQTSYQPKLSFSLDSVQAVPLAELAHSANGDQLVRASAPGHLTRPTLAPATVRVLGQEVPISWLRLSATPLALLAAAFAAVAATRARTQRLTHLPAFRGRVVTATNIDLGTRAIIDIGDADSLARLAGRYDTAIIHTPRSDGELYHVIADDALYRYARPVKPPHTVPSKAGKLEQGL